MCDEEMVRMWYVTVGRYTIRNFIVLEDRRSKAMEIARRKYTRKTGYSPSSTHAFYMGKATEAAWEQFSILDLDWR